jgi:hypothetical protein
MNRHSIHRRSFLTSSLAFTGSLVLPEPLYAGEPLVVVVGADSKLRDISSAVLRRVFLSRPTPSPDAARFIPLNHRKADAARVHFDRAVLELEPDEVQRYWVDQKIRGVKPPRIVGVEVLPKLLDGVPGTIAYVAASQIGGLRPLKVDGQAPDSGKYLLK